MDDEEDMFMTPMDTYVFNDYALSNIGSTFAIELEAQVRQTLAMERMVENLDRIASTLEQG